MQTRTKAVFFLKGLSLGICLLVWAHPAAGLLFTRDTSALATVVYATVTRDSDSDPSDPSASASASASGAGFTGSADASADASNLLDLKLSGSAAMAVTSGQGQSTSFSRIDIKDELALGVDPSLAGQSGIISASLFIEGSWDAPDNVGQINTNVEVGTGTVSGSAFNYTGLLAARLNQPALATCREGGIAVQCFGLFTFDIPFLVDSTGSLVTTTGAPLVMLYLVTGRAAVSAQSGGLPGLDSGTASYDLADSILWGGFSSLTVGGQLVTDYSFASGSGVDWRQSAIPTGAVPEPATLALLGLGLSGLAVARRRRIH